MLEKLTLTYAGLDDYPYYLLSDNAFQWDSDMLQDAMDRNRNLFPELTDDEYYGKTLMLDITGLTEKGEELWRQGAVEALNQLSPDTNLDDVDLEPWNDPGTDPDYYLTGSGDPRIDGRDYILRHFS